MEKTATPTIRNLYPHLSEKELMEAEDNLDRYLALVLRIFERVELEANAQTPLCQRSLKLTHLGSN